MSSGIEMDGLSDGERDADGETLGLAE